MGNEKKWKALAYVIAGARVCTEKQPHLTLTTDEGRVLEGRSIIFGNGRKYGGPLNFFAEADNSDGLLDAVVFRHSITSIIGEFLMAAVQGGFHSRRSGSFEYIRMTGEPSPPPDRPPANWTAIMQETLRSASPAPAR